MCMAWPIDLIPLRIPMTLMKHNDTAQSDENNCVLHVHTLTTRLPYVRIVIFSFPSFLLIFYLLLSLQNPSRRVFDGVTSLYVS